MKIRIPVVFDFRPEGWEWMLVRPAGTIDALIEHPG